MPAEIVAADAEPAEYAALLRDDFASFAAWCFRELNPRTRFAPTGMSRSWPAIPGTARQSLPQAEAGGLSTQLIQELIEQGLRAVTRYQPQSHKIMRMHAQTAMIENGFVHLPKEEGWLAEYLHELTVFPKGKHDDQVDSTAQMLDWFKQAGSGPTSNAGIWHLYREQYEAQQAGLQTARPEPLSVMARRLGILRPL
jgi:hypothetical protein